MSDDQRDSEGERSGEEGDAGAKEGPSVGKGGPTEGTASDGGGEQPRSATPPQPASPPSKETPPAKNDDARYIKLRVVGNVSNQDSNGINFRLKWTTALLKLKKSYSNHVGIPISNLRFLFDGRRITDEDTPKQLDMNDDDQIEVYHEQTGGC